MQTIKKIVGIVLSVTVLSNASAFAANSHPLQGFNDAYSVIGGNVEATTIISGQLTAQQLNPQEVLISEPTGVLAGGVFTLTAGTDSSHSCVLTIQDVDYQVPQLLNQQCTSGYSVKSFVSNYNSVVITVG